MTASEKVGVAILRPGATEPVERQMPKESRHIQRLFRRLRCEGRVEACYEAGGSGYDLYRQIPACGVRFARRHDVATVMARHRRTP